MRRDRVSTALVVRLDNAGDVLLAGPAVRAVAVKHRVTFLAGPRGAAAAGLLPGVGDVMTWRAPWVDLDPPAVSPADIGQLARHLAEADFAAALVLTSFHQSPLPTALVLRLAGVRNIAAISTDYPGSLLDVRHRLDADVPEPERGLSLARAAGFALPEGDDGRLAVRGPLPDTSALTGGGPYVVAHPGASAPARRWPFCRWAEAVAELIHRGHRVILTGTAAERDLTAAAAAGGRDTPSGTVSDLAGRTDLRQLAAVLAGAQAVLVANTGVAHLAAAVGTPVACLFAPVVPAARWAPYRVPHALLGDQQAACRDSRAVLCPVPGHPCLASVTAATACDAIDDLTGRAASATGQASQLGQPCAC
jgi:ADP-heptose:LPS heptosyltransferase